MIDFTKVLDIHPSENTFIVSPGYGDVHKIASINTVKLPADAFRKQVFLYKKHLKSRILPEDRVAAFESQNSDGVFCFDKYARVFNSRLRPDEEQERIIERNNHPQDKANKY